MTALAKFGRSVRDQRVDARLKQTELAGRVGLTRSSIANLEAGRQSISLATAADIAIALGRTVSGLLGETEDTPMTGNQVGGTHYEEMPMMPFQIIDAFGLDFYAGNALKYLLRAGRKPGADKVEELKKARHYLDEMIQRAEHAS